MRILFGASIIIAALAGCDSKPKEIVSPIGVWQNPVQWDNNKITLTVRPDSVMMFKAEKSFCPGTKFFISIGKWHIEQDSFLVMEPFTDGRHYELHELFPELVQSQKDSMNVISLDVNAKLIFNKEHVYDVQPDGKRSPERFYNKIGEPKE